MERIGLRPQVHGRETGNAIILSFLLVVLLTALSFAHFMVVQKNSRQAGFVSDLGKLRRYAESGVSLAIQKLEEGGTGAGDVGTKLWTAVNDVGKDGRAWTGDEGEGDGIPTPGEPNLTASPLGPAAEGIGLLVSTTDTIWPNVKRIISTASNPDNLATIEVYARGEAMGIPGVGAVYVQPGAVLDFNGNALRIDGHDTNPDGTRGPGEAVYGLATSLGDPVRSNSDALIDQIPLGRVDQIMGQGGVPSIGETAPVDFDGLFKAFKESRSFQVDPGSYTNVVWGNDATGSYQVTYTKGDVRLSGNGKGAGVLVVDGSLILSGKFQFVGLVMVRGDVRLTGGGSEIHVFGSMMIGQTLTAIDPVSILDPIDVRLSGNSEVRYSSLALARAKALLRPGYAVLYWKNLH